MAAANAMRLGRLQLALCLQPIAVHVLHALNVEDEGELGDDVQKRPALLLSGAVEASLPRAEFATRRGSLYSEATMVLLNATPSIGHNNPMLLPR